MVMYRKKHALRLLALLLSMLLLAGCGNGRTTKETEDTTFGIDVSRYQGTIDWQQVAASGVDFAMIRAGYRSMDDGTIKEDPNACYNLQEAAAAGVSIGVYFFSTALDEEEAAEEAAWVAELIGPYPITYPVVYDCEGFGNENSRQYGLDKKVRTDNALAFLEAIEKCGYEGMFYSSRNEMEGEAKWEMSRIDPDYKVWVAQYPAEPYPATERSSYSGEHHMWQYTTDGMVPGIPVNVDMNICYFGYDGIEKPKSEEEPDRVGPNPEAMHDFEAVSEQVTAKEETNLRDVPSQDVDSRVMYTLKNGEIAQRIAISSTGWSKVTFEGNVYYAVSSYLTTDLYSTPSSSASAADDGIETEFTPVSYTVTAKQKVNLRALPSVEHEDAVVLAQLKNGDTASCVGTSDNGWSKLIYNGTTCYAVSSYLKTVSGGDTPATEADDGEIQTKFMDMNDLVTAKDEVNLRKLPSVTDPDAVVVARLHNGDVVTRTGINEDVGWSRVIYNGMTLYCVSSYLEPAKG